MDEPIAAAWHLIAQGQERRWRGFAKIQIAIGIVFDHNGFVLDGQFQHAQASLKAQGRAAGVAKSGNEVDQFGLVLHHQGFELIHLHAVGVNWHADHLGTVQTKTLDGGQKRGRFDQGHIAGVEQGFGDQVQRLLAACGDNQAFWVEVFHTLGSHEGRELFAQRVVAFGRTVLQGSTGFFGQCAGAGLANAFHVKQGAVWKAAGKADDAGLAQQFEEFADGRSFDVVEAVSKLHEK